MAHRRARRRVWRGPSDAGRLARGAIAGAFVILVGVVAWGMNRHPAEQTPAGATRHAIPVTVPVTEPPTVPPTTVPDPGLLPQTRDLPPSSGPLVDPLVQGLWHAIVTDDPSSAMSFFFPLSAYVQVKAISSPALDWQNRLVAHYEQDIHHLHALLGSGASDARLVSYEIPSAAQWIVPGVEYNKIGYWRVYGTTLNYAENGHAGTFSVTSLISWRGVWYVVHLGAIR